MKAFQQRVIDEKTELDEKRQKLSEFFDNDKFNELEASAKDLLETQYYHMSKYSETLGERIKLFNQEQTNEIKARTIEI